MNRKYIKRQIILNDLGFPIDEDIKDIITEFDNLVNVRELTKYEGTIFETSGYIYFKGNVPMFFYHKNKDFFVVNHKMWDDIINKVHFESPSILNILAAFMEHFLNLEIIEFLRSASEVKSEHVFK